MKKSKKKILYFIGLLGLVVAASITAIAVFVFNQEVTVETTIGDMETVDKYYINYAKENSLSTDDPNYDRAQKLRADTIAVIERIRLTPTTTYVATHDQYFLSNKDYYLDNQGQEKYDPSLYEVGDEIKIALFEANVTYNGVESVTGYDVNLANITFTISGSSFNFKKTADETITITITRFDSSTGLISAATISSSASGKDYTAVIGTNSSSMIIIDNAITRTVNNQANRKTLANRRITCSATTNKLREENPYLSHLGLQFSFRTKIAAYVRIQINDAWTRTRIYSSNVRNIYTTKGLIGGVSPFLVSDPEWYYDVNTNCVYLKEMVSPQINEETGEYEIKSYTFPVNGGYFYNVSNSGVYTEYVNVDVSFRVEMVEANRAKSVWGIDPSTDLNY